jgi:hypothetical protein
LFNINKKTAKIENKANNTANQYIAIDDITFSQQCVPPNGITVTPPPINTTASVCTSTQFMCAQSRTCIDIIRLCDFFIDCDDASDEKECGSCTFDKNQMCGWTNIGKGIQQWSLQTASKFSAIKTIPKTDSRGYTNGSFLIIDTTTGNTRLKPL